MHWMCAYLFSIFGAFWVLLFGVLTQRNVARHSLSYRILIVLIIAILWPVSVPLVVKMANNLQGEKPTNVKSIH